MATEAERRGAVVVLAAGDSLADVLRRYREAAGLTQEELAERAGLSREAISLLERGQRRRPQAYTLRKLAAALALTEPEQIAFLATARRPSARAWVDPGQEVGTLPAASAPPIIPCPTNLPLALTSFVGREREVATVRRLLSHSRLLTLTGAGGCGKTRLALEVARALAGDAHATDVYADGLWLVELAALGEGPLVPGAVASVLGVRERPGQALLDSLSAYLQSRRVLLLLDNCEHLVADCAQLAEALLRACPQLTILATSREALGIGGERPWQVPSLRLPEPRSLLTEEQALAAEAVQLFVQRAQVVRPDFAPTAQHVKLATQVCRRLDGIPLAIELAAARLAALALDQLATRLDDRFDVLAGGSRTALPRQQTLRATLDWSYDLLSAAERLLLQRLAVFAGGWTLEAAEAVCAGKGLAAAEVLELLAGLVAKSLVQMEEGGTSARYRLLETVRQYGREKLLATGEAAWVQERHLAWCLDLVRQAEQSMGRPEQEERFAQLEAELENLRAALAWSSREASRRETGLQLAEALRWFWVVRGHLAEARQWLQDLLPSASAAGLRARALDALAEVVQLQCEFGRALVLSEESLALHRQTGNRASAAHALLQQGMVTTWLGDYPRATALIEEALPVLREQGERHGVGWALGSLGTIVRLQGDLTRATELCEESLAIFQELGDKFGSSVQLGGLARVAWDLGNVGRAQELYRESLQACSALVEKGGCASCFEGLAIVAAAEGQPARAAHLFGAARVLREVTGTRPEDIDRPAYGPTVAAVRAALGEEAYAAAWAAGRAMGLEEAIAYAL